MSFIAELKRRNVVKVGIAYVVASWLLLQLTEVLTELLEIGPEVGKIVIVLLIVGFVPALIFAWAFEMTPEGIKREHEVDRSQSVVAQTGRKLDFAIIGMLVVIAGYFIWESRFMERPGQPAEPVASVEPAQPDARDEPVQGATPAEPARSGPGNSSIAVLPFANRSLQEEDTFFTDGIHDDLLTQLAKINDLKVISRTSVMKYKDTEKTIPEIAGELGVGTILEGGVQRAGKRIRINAQLINVATDEHLWAETFDREMTVENIFDIQTEITRQIVGAVRGELTDEEQQVLGKTPTDNLEAYEAYLHSLSMVNRADYAAQNFVDAEVWANKAVTLDPNFAQAWAVLVEVHGQMVWLGYDTSAERKAMAAEALARARELGPGLPEVLAAEAEYVYRIEEDFPRALTLFRRAHEAMPGSPQIMTKLAVAQRRTPDVEGAVASFLKALDIDPNYDRVTSPALETIYSMGDMELGKKLAESWMIRFPDITDVQVYAVQIYFSLGEFEAAQALWERIEPSSSAAYFVLATEYPFWVRDLDQAIATWDIPEIKAWADNRGFGNYGGLFTGWAHLLKGEEATGQDMLRGFIDYYDSLEPTETYLDGFEAIFAAIAYALTGEPDKAVKLADHALTLIPIEDNQLFGAWVEQNRAHVLALAGKRDEALAEIERQFHTPYKMNKRVLAQDQRWDFFRDDPRFVELIRPDGGTDR